MEDKKTIRARIRAMRRDIDQEDASYASEILSDLFFEIPDERLKALLKGGTAGLYMPFDGEIDVLPLAQRLRSAGVKTAFPRVSGDGIIFLEADDTDLSLFEKGSYGIREPLESLPVTEPDLIIVPGVAYNDEGVRLGMGAGYYDRYYSEHLEAVYVGVCYDIQVISDLPFDEDDMACDILIPVDVGYDEDSDDEENAE